MSDFLGMSDEEFDKMLPPDSAQKQINQETPSTDTTSDTHTEEQTDKTPAEDTTSSQETETDGSNAEGENQTTENKTTEQTEQKPADNQTPPKDETASSESPKEGTEQPKADAPALNYEELYKQILKPFKANDQMMQVNSPEEAIRLMQQGANYSKKMNEMAPHRKKLMMLEANGLGENELTYLIDLHKKDPEAIKKLIKDSGLDPLDIDVSKEPAYREGNHRITDEEVNFQTVVDELRSSADGKNTLNVINADWDQASKQWLWENPNAMRLFHTHRENGIYDRIKNEVGRQRALGNVQPEVTFLQAYKLVGDKMEADGMFADIVKPVAAQPQNTPKAEPLATKTAVPKSTVSNSDKAGAASQSRPSPNAAKTVKNPLSMSDADFEKQYADMMSL